VRQDPDLVSDVRTLLHPRSIVVVGASPRNEDAVRNALAAPVPAYGVNPGRDEVLGLRCWPRVADLPEVPELAFLGVNHNRIEDALDEALAAGVRAFVVPGLGAEAGREGKEITERVATKVRAAGGAMVGPNCMGVVVPGGVASWIGSPPETTVPGHVAVLCQSGSIADAFLSLGGRVGIRCVVSLGSEAVTGVADYLTHLADDDGTRAIGLFLETVRQPTRFAEGLARCAAAGKPVVCLKVGRSEAAARAALSHTGALVGSGRAFSAVLRRFGAIEVDDFQELTETLEILGRRRWPTGMRIAAVSESGGECGLLADQAEAAGIPYPPLSSALAERLRERFPNYVAPGNPLDAWAVAEADEVYPGSLELLAASGEFDVLQAQIDLSQFRDTGNDGWSELTLRALARVADEHGLFPVATTVHSADPPRAFQQLARELDLALLRGPRAALRALGHVARWHPAVTAPDDHEGPVALDELIARSGPVFEHESSTVLERYGIRFAPRRRATTPDEAAAAADELGYPVVVKVDGVAHKARDAGVVLGIESADHARRAADVLGGRVLVAAQLAAAPEAFVGMTRDADHGPILAVGRGGVAIEELDTAVSAAGPLNRATALRLVREAGFDQAVDALADALLAVSRLAFDHPSVVEVDVNPLLLHGDDATAVDALVIVEEPS
ncbi:MAG: acetate--CoA ligase family protein, partial [Gaiella sp.]